MAGQVAVSQASMGKKVTIIALGSRGDVQPFVGLCVGLAKSGLRPMLLTNANHVGFAKGFGIEAREVFPDTEAMMRATPGLLDCMMKNDFLKFVKILSVIMKEAFPKSFQQMLGAIEDFQPDIILAHQLAMFSASAIGGVRGVPVLLCDLAGFVPSGSYPSFVCEPAWLGSWVHRGLNRFFMFAMLVSERDTKIAHFKEVYPQGLPFVPKNLEQLEFGDEFRAAPELVGHSSMLVKRAPDWTHEPVLTGFWVVGPEEQERRLASGDQDFAGCGETGLREFLESGPTPVYVGWGSMICVSSEHMTLTAVRALKLASLRGVVLGGWARLSAEHLAGQPDSAELLAYAQQHVLFVRTAPHEWLLPRCAASVHHGGAGTTAAAWRSGRPMVVTPCGFDQPLNAAKVADSGAGLALPNLAKVTPEKLADALRRATSDAAMIARAAELGAKLKEEDGVGNAVRAIDDFYRKEVATGSWAEKEARRIAKMRDYDAPSLFTRIGFLCSKICTNRITSQVKW